MRTMSSSAWSQGTSWRRTVTAPRTSGSTTMLRPVSCENVCSTSRRSASLRSREIFSPAHRESVEAPRASDWRAGRRRGPAFTRPWAAGFSWAQTAAARRKARPALAFILMILAPSRRHPVGIGLPLPGGPEPEMAPPGLRGGVGEHELELAAVRRREAKNFPADEEPVAREPPAGDDLGDSVGHDDGGVAEHALEGDPVLGETQQAGQSAVAADDELCARQELPG